MKTFEILCLANSRKYSGRCVAGLATDGSGWLRPVSPVGDGALFSYHYRLNDATDVRVMDVIQIELVQPRPEVHQPENWVVGQSTWQLIQRGASVQDYRSLLRASQISGPDLLGNTSDRVDFNSFLTRPASSSLALIAVQQADLSVTTSFSGKRQIRAAFTLCGANYNLGVTDPEWEQKLLTQPLGSIYQLQNVIITVSLGEPFNGYCFKIVAAIVPF